MDTLLIIIIFVLVIGIGFILSRPFMRDDESQEYLPLDDSSSPIQTPAGTGEKATPLEKAISTDVSTICPKCGHSVKSKDKFCTHCGSRLHL